MSLNLNKFLAASHLPTNFVVVSAAAECSPLVYSLAQIHYQRLGRHFLRRSIAADRYFEFTSIGDELSAGSLFGDGYFYQIEFKTKPSKEQQQQLNELLPKLTQDAFLWLSIAKLDKRDLHSAWFKAINEQGALLQITGSLPEARLWCQYLLADAKISMQPDALDLVINMNQNNFSQLAQDINRLCLLYQPGALIDVESVQSNLVDNSQYNIFALSHAYLAGESTRALKIFQNVYQGADDAILISWCLTEDIRKLLQIKGRLRHNPDFNAAIANLRIWGEQVAAFKAATSRLSYQQLLDAFNQLAVIDHMQKGLKPGSVVVKLEQLVIFLCRGGE